MTKPTLRTLAGVAAPAALLLATALLVPANAAPGAEGAALPRRGLSPIEADGVASGLSAPARRLPTYAAPDSDRMVEAPDRGHPPVDPATQTDPTTARAPQPRNGVTMPGPSLSFAGMATSAYPPDPSGEAGPNHYVQMVNGTGGANYQVFDKSGVAQTGVLKMGDLWPNTDPCSSDPVNGRAGGDGNVLYDQFNDRWIMTQFTDTQDPMNWYYVCIASSQTANPAGAWYTHRFTQPNERKADYLKFGVFGDGLYMTANEFATDVSNDGVAVRAIELADLYSAGSVNGWYWHLAGAENFYSLVPADVDGPTPPPASEDEWFFSYDLDKANTLLRWHAQVPSWTDPLNVFLWQEPDVTVAAFTPDLCLDIYHCIPQPGTASTLDSITDGLMWRMAYRNMGDRQIMVATHAVNVDDQRTGIRWYQWEWTSGQEPYAPKQTGTYSPDTVNRWIPTPALDGQGNLAIGFNVSDATSVYPGIRYAGRLASDYPGTLAQGEAELQAGGGSLTSATGRFGDYSHMSVDPTDDCTFWLTAEYVAATSATGWSTRVGTFKYPACDLPETTTTGRLSKPYKKSGNTYYYHLGDKESFSTTVAPNQAGGGAAIWIERKSSGTWANRSNIACTLNAESRCKHAFKTRAMGKGLYRAMGNFPGDAEDAGSSSSWFVFKITK